MGRMAESAGTGRMVRAALACAGAFAWGWLGAAEAVSGAAGYPGFDAPASFATPEAKEPGWFNGVSRKTASEQLAYAAEQEKEGNLRAARRAYDALVREWPASVEAPKAQFALAVLLAEKENEPEDAFDALEYLLVYYPKDCSYRQVVAYELKLADRIREARKLSWFGRTFGSVATLRRRYESIVRRAPGEAFVPATLMVVAELRREEGRLEEEALVYGSIGQRYPRADLAPVAAYREARVRMELVRKLAYNQHRCQDVRDFLKVTLRRRPDLPEAGELRAWLAELEDYMAEADWKRAAFYDSRQRTAHAAIAAYERYCERHPQSAHAEEARARIAELKNGGTKK